MSDKIIFIVDIEAFLQVESNLDISLTFERVVRAELGDFERV